MSNNYRTFAINFGSKIVEIRKSRKMTQEELADLAGIERSYMGAIERGERNPTLLKVYKIAQALKIPTNRILP